MSIRVSPISKTASLLIIAVGAFVLVGGLSTGDEASIVAGVAFVVLGLILYRLLFRFARKLKKELDEAEPRPSAPGSL